MRIRNERGGRAGSVFGAPNHCGDAIAVATAPTAADTDTAAFAVAAAAASDTANTATAAFATLVTAARYPANTAAALLLLL